MRVVVVGGGITGLAAGLFLGRRGHRVTVLEREPRPLGPDLDAEFTRLRPRVPQAVQPHSLLAPVRTVLRTEAPDVYAELLRRGATEWHEFDWFGEHPPARAGDDELVTVRGRRILLEAALTAAVQQQADLTLRHGAEVTGLLMDGQQVTGVGLAGGEALGADLVVDAAGRRSPVPALLAAAGTRPPVVENHRTGIAYFCRWYRLRPDAPASPGRVRAGAATPFASGGVFPGDNGWFAVALTVGSTDPTRTALRDPAVFERLARTFTGCADWLALPHDPVGPVRAMAGLDNRWTSLVDARGPVATGLLSIGDSLVHLNPTHGQGIPLGFRAAQWLAHHAGPADAGLSTGFHRWALAELRPWFDGQVAADLAFERELTERGAAAPLPDAPATVRSALPWCALEDPQVMRARAQVRHLVRPAAEAYADPAVQDRVSRWLADRPGFRPPADGPTRDRWERLAAATAT
ncbi:NAD(P)/FAD-dependent oxidoreductase [Kitasatospora sp. NPDC058965]|uniref:NAD(P)/FAD-dependent oxidoreductase n=1 Tax=Kitasatospora sp. NPDC058965 TaxID=3346682 RepID=UPI0036AEBB30